MNDEKLFTPAQAANYVGMHKATLARDRKKVRAGLKGITFVQVGRNVFYRKADLDAFIASRFVVIKGD